MSDYDKKKIEEAVEDYLKHGKEKTEDLLEIPGAAFFDGVKERHGITKQEYKKVQDAIDFETTVAAATAKAGLIKKIEEASKEDLKSDEFRRDLSSTVRIPTLGGSTEVEVTAEKLTRNPFHKEGDEGDGTKINYGITRTSIKAKGRVFKEFHTEASDAIRKAFSGED